MQTASRRRVRTALVALLATVAMLVAPAPATAYAPNDDEGGTAELRDALEDAARGYADAKIKLDNSKKEQLKYSLELQKWQVAAEDLRVRVGLVARQSYRMGRATTLSMLLQSGSSADFLDRATRLDMIGQVDARQLQLYLEAEGRVKQAKLAIDQEIRAQQAAVNQMAKKRKSAENALAKAGSNGASGGFLSANSPLAKPAPRNSDGSWPTEKCIVEDPTPATGCITPRTVHALRQAQAAGFTRYASCKRTGGGGEHPKGRACDFAADRSGFANENATGGDKAYGDRLAAYFVKNASRLGVMYVIWYREIWMPGSGWRSYSGSGSPAATHTNHVHLSML
ncbi:coiled-coil domain-containing protein [Spirilliplanes yamanashiensis]|uniref:coiled-coil domain-containing protein n=1 Tax=Spirilliplanes yamanashiensis TaxID=42233 RepID=UPI003521D508